MESKRAEMKAEMLAQAEMMIEELLDWNEANAAPNLTQIEDVILMLRKRIGEQMAQVVVESQASNQPVPGPLCEHCGGEMRYKGRKANTVESRAGGLRLERGHYYCEPCGARIFPPG